MKLHPYDVLPLPAGGSLIFTPCPGTKGVDLETSIEQLRQAGADALVTLMPVAELARYSVSSLPDVVRQAGMRWFHFPAEDDAAPGPAFDQAWQAGKAEVLSLLGRDRCVAIHCRGGSGRTGFMAAMIMLELGMDGAQVTGLVKGLRPNSLKLPAHREYLAAHYDKKS